MWGSNPAFTTAKSFTPTELYFLPKEVLSEKGKCDKFPADLIAGLQSTKKHDVSYMKPSSAQVLFARALKLMPLRIESS